MIPAWLIYTNKPELRALALRMTPELAEDLVARKKAETAARAEITGNVPASLLWWTSARTARVELDAD